MAIARTQGVLPVVLSYKDAASYLGLSSVGALRNMVYRGIAPVSIAYGRRDRRFRVADLDAWIDARPTISLVRTCIAPANAPTKRRGRPTKTEVIARSRIGL
jgi:hypothetical protein